MITPEAFYGIGIAVLAYGGYQIFKVFKALTVYLRRLSRVASFLYEKRESISALSVDLGETMKGANKINQDAVNANIALVNEVVKLREAVDKFTSTVVPPPEPTAAQYNPTIMEERYEDTYQDLLNQGLDPEFAKIRAAEYELNYIANSGVTNVGISA